MTGRARANRVVTNRTRALEAAIFKVLAERTLMPFSERHFVSIEIAKAIEDMVATRQ